MITMIYHKEGRKSQPDGDRKVSMMYYAQLLNGQTLTPQTSVIKATRHIPSYSAGVFFFLKGSFSIALRKDQSVVADTSSIYP